MPYAISIDTGGTFTDAVVSDESGRFWIGKAPTTPAHIAAGIRDALAAAAPLGLEVPALLARTSLLVYGTTAATNAVVTGERARTALLSLSSIDVRSVGAGGGSIAWLDDGGLLRVGPQSAGAEPGPACYGHGGTAATVTDAAVVAGYLLPERFLAGRMPLDRQRAWAAVEAVAAPLGRPATEAAAAILHVAGETMLAAVLDVTVAEGLDPRECTLVAGGGAAGLNVVALARELGCARVLLPRTATALSACGMQFADVAIEGVGDPALQGGGGQHTAPSVLRNPGVVL